MHQALQVAALAWQEGFDVWLDVLDPDLASLTPGTHDYALAVACVIEMALLNSTHLLAVLTSHTKGSEWVPYEFGRTKADALVAENTASWRAEPAPPQDLAEYLYLCPVHDDKVEVRGWLQQQRALAPKAPVAVRPRPSWLPTNP